MTPKSLLISIGKNYKKQSKATTKEKAPSPHPFHEQQQQQQNRKPNT